MEITTRRINAICCQKRDCVAVLQQLHIWRIFGDRSQESWTGDTESGIQTLEVRVEATSLDSTNICRRVKMPQHRSTNSPMTSYTQNTETGNLLSDDDTTHNLSRSSLASLIMEPFYWLCLGWNSTVWWPLSAALELQWLAHFCLWTRHLSEMLVGTNYKRLVASSIFFAY